VSEKKVPVELPPEKEADRGTQIFDFIEIYK
jgi:hypothetical protein